MAFENSQPSAELAAADEIVAAAQNPPQRLPSSDILEDLRDQDRCIKTPEEYVAAFEAREARCSTVLKLLLVSEKAMNLCISAHVTSPGYNTEKQI